MFPDVDPSRDDPVQLGGRLRTFAHERGNWASYVYIPVDGFTQHILSDVANSLVSDLKSIAAFRPLETFHISLSRTFVVRHHWISPLLQELQTRLSRARSMTLHFTDLKYFTNDEKTRSFLVLRVGGGIEMLQNCVKGIDSALEEFRLPKYYEEPSFHVSLAWAPGDITDGLTSSHQQHYQKTFDELQESELQVLHPFGVAELSFKTGNKTFRIPLTS